MRKSFKLLLLSLLLTFSVTNVFAATFQENGSIDLDGVEEVVIELKHLATVGSVKLNFMSVNTYITSHDENQLRVDLDMRVKSTAGDGLPEIILERDGTTVTVKFDSKNKKGVGFFRWGEINSYIQLPFSYKGKLQLITSTNDAVFQDLKVPELDIRSKVGNIELRNVKSDSILLNNELGDVLIDQVEAEDIFVRSSVGIIKCREANIADTSFENTYGKIDVEQLKAIESKIVNDEGHIFIDKIEGKVHMQSSEGNIRAYLGDLVDDVIAINNTGVTRLYIRKESSFDYQITNNVGAVKFDFPCNENPEGNISKSCTGTVGDGGPLLMVSVATGNIHILPY